MSNRKNSVLLYTDDMEILEDLTLEQRGVLLTAVLSYQAGAELPEMDSITKVAFKFMKKQIDANNQAYEETCEKRKHAADSRWRKEKCDADKAENSATKSFATANEKAASKLNEPERKEAKAKDTENDEKKQAKNSGEEHTSAFLGNAKHANAFSDDANYASAFFACRKNANAWENDKENDKENESEKDIDIEKEKDIDIDIDKCAVPLSNINNIYSAREEPESSTARSESPPEETKEIVDAWNSCANTIEVKDVVPCSPRDDNLRRLIKQRGFDEVLQTVKGFDENLYFTQANKVGFDWFLKPQNYQKVIEGNYRELWTKPKARQGNNKFKNFTQRSNDDVYAQLEKVIYD